MIEINDEELKGVYEENEKSEKKTQKKTKKKPTNTLFAKVQSDPIKTIRQLISVTESAMQERVMVWDRYRRKYRRGMYYLRNVTNGVPLYFTNYIYANIESIKANMTRNLPKLNASPRGTRDDLAADLMSKVLQDSLERGGLQQSTREVVHHGLLATLAYFKIHYSDIKDNLVVDCITPENLLVDPKATTLDDTRWIIHRRRNVPIDEIYAEYGEIPKEIKKDADESLEGVDPLSERGGLYVTEGELQPAIDVTGTYDVYECWIRVWDEDRENDWYIVTVAGGSVLRSEFSVYNHNRHPFIVWFATEDFGADNIYHRGIGAIEEIEPLQDRVDAVDLKIYKHISLLTNRQRFVSNQSGLNINTIDNTSGRTYAVNGDPTRAIFYDSPPQMPMEVYQYRDNTEMLIQTVSGVFDVTQGRRPTGITAGRAIESLKDSAETRLAAMVDTLAASLETVGNLALQIILQFYDGARLIKATDGDKDIDFMIVADYPEELQPQPTPMLGEMGEALIDEETGGYQYDSEEELEVDEQLEMLREQWKQENGIALVLSDVTYEWDIRANTDSALPSARAERGQIAADLFRIGGIDREALLEAMDFPGRHKIMQRLAAEATGKSAGDPNVDGDPVGQMLEILTQMGLPPEMIEQIAQAMQQQGGQPAQPTGTTTVPPQMTM
jgi:hypothetical protein